MSYSFNGGLRLPYRLSKQETIETLQPSRILLQLPEGARLLVEKDTPIFLGTLLGENEEGKRTYSSLSGKVLQVEQRTLQDGTERQWVMIENDRQYQVDPACRPSEKKLSQTTEEELKALIEKYQVYEPLTGRFLSESLAGAENETDILIVSLVSADPALQCYHEMAASYAREIVGGAKILVQLLHASSVVFAVPSDDYVLQYFIKQAIVNQPFLKIAKMRMKYPQGNPVLLRKQLAKNNTSFAVDAECCLELFKAFVEGVPSVTRILSVQNSRTTYGTYRVPLGMFVSEIFDAVNPEIHPSSFWNGGFVGYGMPTTNIPYDHSIRSAHYLPKRDQALTAKNYSVCIHCGRCADVCPMGLMPGEIWTLHRSDRTELYASVFADRCICCGLCSYVCPEQLNVFAGVQATMRALKSRQTVGEEVEVHGNL